MKTDVLVVGGGPAGMAAALKCDESGFDVVLVERNGFLGGILNQCIHNGFGLQYFKEELTGPEYAYKFAEKIENSNVKVMLNTFVNEINSTNVEIINQYGDEIVEAKSVILAMGCRERTAGSIFLKGTRPSGVYTAGQVQKMVNIEGKVPGKKIVILGSGDIGLIMARRMTLEGAKVECVLEIMNESAGLQRNISQCLDDFEIPLFLNTTVSRVVGESKLEGVFICQVDENKKQIKESEKFIECDTLLLSVGLIPENDIVKCLETSAKTSGADVDEYNRTNIEGVFSCGNVLHVHDIADMVSKEAERTAKSVCEFLQNKIKKQNSNKVVCGEGVRYSVPTKYHEGEGEMTILFRSTQKFVKSFIVVKQKEKIIAKKFCLAIIPSEMQEINFSKSNVQGDIEICVMKNV